MSVDPAIQEAISESVRKHGQPTTLADKLVRWFDEVISGNEDIDDVEVVYKRLDILFRAVETGDPQEEPQ